MLAQRRWGMSDFRPLRAARPAIIFLTATLVSARNYILVLNAAKWIAEERYRTFGGLRGLTLRDIRLDGIEDQTHTNRMSCRYPHLRVTACPRRAVSIVHRAAFASGRMAPTTAEFGL